MAKTTTTDDDGENSWASVFKSVADVAKSGVDTYASSAGLKHQASSNPNDYRASQNSSRQPDGTPVTTGTAWNNVYLMWGALALFVLVILVLLIKVL